jgi:hypothetical protein
MQKTACIILGLSTTLVLGSRLAAEAGVLQSPGCLAGGEVAIVDAVDADLQLHLRDGRVVQLAGIQAATVNAPDPAVTVRSSLASWLVAASVRVSPLRAEPDRWGRTVALVFASPSPGEDKPVSVTEAILEAGLAAAMPDAALKDCWSTYMQMEAAARDAHAGLWAKADAVLTPADRPALLGRLGTWTLVQGRIGQVRVGHSRTYLRFGQDRGSGFVVAVDGVTSRHLARTLGSLDGWVGRQVLARGLLDDRWGLQIDVTSPEQVELLPP